MSIRTTICAWAMPAAALAFAACAGTTQPQQAEQGLSMRSVTDTVCTDDNNEPPTFDIAVLQPGCAAPALDANGDPIPSFNLGLTELINVDELDLDTPVSGVWVGGDWFLPLPVGDYCVTVTTNGGAWGEDTETQVNDGVTVEPGATTEIVFAFDCTGGSIAALDIVVLVNEGPSITDFFYGPSGKFVLACEPGAMGVSWTSPQTDDITVTCEAYDAIQTSYTFPNANPKEATWTETVSALAGVEYTSDWSWALPDPDTYYVYCNLQNTSGQVTTFQSILHVNSAPAGVCTVGDEVVAGYASPSPDQGEIGEFNMETVWLSGDVEVWMMPLVIDLPGAQVFDGPGGSFLAMVMNADTDAAGTIAGFGGGAPGDPARWSAGLVPVSAPNFTLGEPMGDFVFEFEYLTVYGILTLQDGVAQLDGEGRVYFTWTSAEVYLYNDATADMAFIVQTEVDFRLLPYLGAPPAFGLRSCNQGDDIALDSECAASLDALPCEEVCEQE